MNQTELLNSSPHVVGTKQTMKAVSNRQAKLVFIASDCNDFMKNKILEACKETQTEYLWADSMDVLGKACGISRGAATAAILKN